MGFAAAARILVEVRGRVRFYLSTAGRTLMVVVVVVIGVVLRGSIGLADRSRVRAVKCGTLRAPAAFETIAMSTEEVRRISLTLEQESDYVFRITFHGTAIPDLMTDESPPTGTGTGPDPTRLLVSAVANCLSASLLFALRKYKNAPAAIRCDAATTLVRNATGRLRVDRIDVAVRLPGIAADYLHLDRALAQFEDFCVVTQSVRSGVAVDVQIHDDSGTLLQGTPATTIA